MTSCRGGGARLVFGAAAVAAAVISGVLGVGLLLASDSDPDRAAPPGRLAPALIGAGAADAPFPGLTEAQVAVGDDCLRIVIADSSTERSTGLRGRRELGGYDGMLFVYGEDTNVGFTMSGVPVPLDIGFYDGRARPVDQERMTPCPADMADCPVYRSGAPFRYALETLGGDLPAGGLGSCAG